MLKTETGVMLMRSITTVAASVLVLSFTACSETSQEPAAQSQPEQSAVVPETVPTSSEAVSHEHSEDGHAAGGHGKKGHGKKGHGHGHGGHGHSVASAETSGSIAVGDKVPEFEVTIDGKTMKLSELRKNTKLTSDGTLVLTFWCSFCHSCRHVEHPLDKLAKQYRGQVGVIALDSSDGETAEVVAEFARENGLTVPIALNPKGTAVDIFGVHATTTTIVIDSKGVLRYCGRFSDREHSYAADALKAVLAGEEVRVKKTRHKG
jgi:thiol-disulfide isomerase/thioredoxin